MSHDFNDTTRIKAARKEHRCEESGCRRTKIIRPGQPYERGFGKYEGDVYDWKTCARCARAWSRTRERFDWDYDEGPCLGQLLDWLRERRSEDRSVDAVRERKATREKNRERRRRPPPETWLVEDLSACGQVRRWVPSVDPLQQRRPESVADWGSAARFDEAGARAWATRWPCLQAVRAADVRASVAYVVLADGVRP